MDAKEVYRYFVTLTLGQFLFKCLIWTAQRLTYVKIFRITMLRLADADPAYLAEVSGFAGRYLDHESCRKLASDPTYDLPESSLDRTCLGPTTSASAPSLRIRGLQRPEKQESHRQHSGPTDWQCIR